jgi:hypothetical protein
VFPATAAILQGVSGMNLEVVRAKAGCLACRTRRLGTRIRRARPTGSEPIDSPGEQPAAPLGQSEEE